MTSHRSQQCGACASVCWCHDPRSVRAPLSLVRMSYVLLCCKSSQMGTCASVTCSRVLQVLLRCESSHDCAGGAACPAHHASPRHDRSCEGELLSSTRVLWGGLTDKKTGNMWLCLQVNVGLAWICALATLILVPSDIYHAMQVGGLTACFCWPASTTMVTGMTVAAGCRANIWRS